ncbi:MaoC family dehydratase [Streptomyces tritici]|uniref:MaoC family dehydratase n=1 Tax=Streptomyces tritici TaxID=2054410 RepID=UPI003AEFE1B1
MRTLLSLAGAVAATPLKRPRPDAPLPAARLSREAVVDARRLARYAALCGFDRAGDAALPLPYPHLLGFPLAMRLMSRRDFPLPLLGLVHTWITVERHAPLTAADRLHLTVRAEALAPHRRGTEVTMVTEARVDGALAWESRSGYLARHTTEHPAGDTPTERGHTPTERAPGHTATRRSPGDTATEHTPGRDTAPTPPLLPARAEWRLPAGLGRSYGAVSGDRNPIHLHPLTAGAFGFPRAIAHGMWTFARCLAESGRPEATRARAEFRAPVLLPATVTYATDGSGAFQLRSGERVHLSGETSARSA